MSRAEWFLRAGAASLPILVLRPKEKPRHSGLDPEARNTCKLAQQQAAEAQGIDIDFGLGSTTVTLCSLTLNGRMTTG